ncbi:MAG: hypothetical protein AAGI07_15180 [Bacteroidota bacterium]
MKYIFFLLLITACSSKRISEDAFESSIWKNDKMGCESKRLDLLDNFEAIKSKIIGISENDTRRLLGAPDKVQLFERSQKFYIYFIEPGKQCEGNAHNQKEGRSYHVRFNSLNQVNEISLALPK